MPELIANGPIVPTRLLNELDNGRLVFFCGAGISAGPESGLPLFAALVDGVYKENHIKPDAVEREALDLDEQDQRRRRPAFDKALGLLERRLGANVLRQTIIKLLSQRPAGPLAIHKALIALSRTTKKGVRLITTNFDNRFIEAGLEENLVDSAPKLPVPKPHSWSSLVHLHGRILPKSDGLNLVVTAADFGRAYLTERWAARFVTELFREFNVVFVGYSVGDPVISYLVDALAAERAKGAGFLNAYAFADYDGSRFSAKKTLDGWQAKNVVPILYRHNEEAFYCGDKKVQNKHKFLHDTLIEWQRIRKDPYQERKKIALREMSKLPSHQGDPVVERVIWALQDPVAADALANAAPTKNENEFLKIKAWLDVFTEYGLLLCNKNYSKFNSIAHNSVIVQSVCGETGSLNINTIDKTRRHLARWLALHLHVPQLFDWAIRSGGYTHPGFVREVQKSLASPDSKIDPRLRFLWTVWLSNEPTKNHLNSGHYSAVGSELEREIIEDYVVKVIDPRYIVLPGPSQSARKQDHSDGISKLDRMIDECGHIKLVSVDRNTSLRFRTVLKNDAFLARHAETLTIYLEKALNMVVKDDNACQKTTLYRQSIADHDQNWDHGERFQWLRLIDLARDSYFALTKSAAPHGNRFLHRWAHSAHPLFKRLALHALTENEKSNINLAEVLLVEDLEPGVWETELRREVLRFFRKAGSRLPEDLQIEIIKLIHAGPNSEQLKQNPMPDILIQREKAVRLRKLSESGLKLSKKSAALIEKFPDELNPKHLNLDEFGFWSEITQFKNELDPVAKMLAESTVTDIVQVLKEGKTKIDEFRRFASMQPDKAVYSLSRLADDEQWPAEYWTELLWILTNLEKSSQYIEKLQMKVGKLLVKAPDALFSNPESAFTAFIKKIAKMSSVEQESEVDTLWNKAWLGFEVDESWGKYSKDPHGIALNSTPGMLSHAALSRLLKYNAPPKSGLPLPIKQYFDKIVDGPKGRLGRVILATKLDYLFAVDEDWVNMHLIPLLQIGSEEANELWSAFAWSQAIGPDLLMAIKEPFLKVLCKSDSWVWNMDYLVYLFMRVCLDSPNELEPRDVHRVVRSLQEEALINIIFFLTQLLGASSTESGEVWKITVGPWLKAFWPTDNEQNSAKTSGSILNLLMKCGSEFPDAVGWAVNYLRPLDQDGSFPTEFEEIAKQYPELLLSVIDKVVTKDSIPLLEKDSLRDILDTISCAKPELKSEVEFQQLYSISTC